MDETSSQITVPILMFCICSMYLIARHIINKNTSIHGLHLDKTLSISTCQQIKSKLAVLMRERECARAYVSISICAKPALYSAAMHTCCSFLLDLACFVKVRFEKLSFANRSLDLIIINRFLAPISHHND